ncbi:LysR family transcriptional regulator [Streptomyces sp. YS415]|uniref:LysR family transcriptional regulator n=1 Tax=Streptomyces sp. YS415 TaxID=2944806 RepID=UPI0020207558|nr:LysR family transcriptional regulator [Streptomyces sp. YS415]MCL7430166.1 LysR substrate-binding domain-containing protein [Streptomyces sp. YS415]
MDLIRHLECFVAVAEESHFGRAASRLGMAQPPLSQRIQRLERELGVRLFDRTSRHVSLTRAGTLLLQDARDLLLRAEALRGTAHRISQGESGLLRAALPSDISGETVAAALADLRTRHPGVQVQLHELTTSGQLAALAAHELDVGLIHHPCDVTGLELGPVLRRELGVLLPRHLAAAALTEVPLTALQGHGLALFPRADAPALYDDVLTTCARNGYTPPAVRHGQGSSFVRGLILSADVIAFAPHDPARPDVGGASDPSVVWRPLAGAPLALRSSVAWLRGRGDTAVQAFAEAVGDALRATAGAGPEIPDRPLHLRPVAEYLL